jgi:hypothetical protein
MVHSAIAMWLKDRYRGENFSTRQRKRQLNGFLVYRTAEKNI